MRNLGSITIRVDFPALDSLVAYLRDKDNQQGQVDALTKQVSELTQKLHSSTDTLQQSINTTKET